MADEAVGQPTVIDTFRDKVPIQNQLQQIHRNLKAELVGISGIAVAIYDEQTDVLKTFVHSSEGDPPFNHYEARLEQVPSLRDLAQSRSFRIIDDLRAREEYGGWHIDRLLRAGYRSSYTTPFYDHGRLFGFLFFDSREPCYFSDRVIRHLLLYSHLISLLIMHEVSRVSAIRSAIDVARQMSRTHNEETGSHLDRMAHYARMIAQGLADRHPAREISDEFVEFVFLYAPLHDIGKIAVPERILMKPDKLSEEEFEIMKKHVGAGMEIVESIAHGFHVGSGQHVEVLRNIVRYHHEAYDGSGYLSGLGGTEIPLESRIVAVADVFDALTTRRCYKNAWSNDKAFALMLALVGQRFDPDCVAALLANQSRIRDIQRQFRPNHLSHEAYTEDI